MPYPFCDATLNKHNYSALTVKRQIRLIHFTSEIRGVRVNQPTRSCLATDETYSWRSVLYAAVVPACTRGVCCFIAPNIHLFHLNTHFI